MFLTNKSKLIPKAFAIQIEGFGSNPNSSGVYRIEFRERVFMATSSEINQMRDNSRVDTTFTDLGKTVRCNRRSITIYESIPQERYTIDSLATCTVYTFKIDVQRFAKAITTMTGKIENYLDKPCLDGFKAVFDIRRFVFQEKTVSSLNMIQTIQIFEERKRANYANRYHSPSDLIINYGAWAKSLIPFFKCKPQHAAYFKQWLMERAECKPHTVWPDGEGELGFNMAGIYGAAICRGEDWSSHT